VTAPTARPTRHPVAGQCGMLRGRAFAFLYAKDPDVWTDPGCETWRVRPLFTDDQAELDIVFRPADEVQPLHGR
jgi:cobyrinic acid a,c-diamide synthase